jgi:hypothetical protein
MTPPPAGPADPVRVRQYLDIFAYCLDECAATRAGPHEVFLWNARRLGEAMLYALAEGTPWAAQPKPLQGRPMDLAELQRKLVAQGLIPSRSLGNLDTLRHCGNVAPLAQGPDTAAETSTLDATRRAVVAVARWFYTESSLQEPMPQQVIEALRDLESEQPRTPRHHRAEMEMRRLRRELEVTGGPSSEGQVELGGAETRPGLNKGLAAAAVVAALACGFGLGWGLKPIPAPVPAHTFAQPVDSTPPPLTATARSQGIAAAATAAAAEPTPANVQAHGADQPMAPAPTPADEATETAPALGIDQGKVADPPEDSADPRGNCPAGALWIPARRLDLIQGPSPRPAWPQPDPDPPAQAIEGFCIDGHSVTAGAFGQWLASRSEDERQNHLRRKGNAALTGAEGLPVNRVTWREAQAYCSDRGGELPSIFQWESAIRHRTAPRLGTGTGEWAADSFPPSAFGYAASAASDQVVYFKEHLGGRANSRKPLLSWQRGTGKHGSPAVSFRCVWPGSAH